MFHIRWISTFKFSYICLYSASLCMTFVQIALLHISVIRFYLDFKISPCPECCICSFGWCPCIWILRRRFGTLSSIFTGDVSRKNNWDGSQSFFLLTSPNKMGLPKRRLKIQTQGHHQQEVIQHSEHGEILKSRSIQYFTAHFFPHFAVPSPAVSGLGPDSFCSSVFASSSDFRLRITLIHKNR